MKVTIDIDGTVPLTKPKLRKFSPDAIINIFGEKFSNRLFKYSKFAYKRGTIVGKYWYFNSDDVYDVEEEKKIIFPPVKSIKVFTYNKELIPNSKLVYVDIEPHSVFPTKERFTKPTTFINLLSVVGDTRLIDEQVVTFDKPKSFTDISKEKIHININTNKIRKSLLYYVYIKIHYNDNSRSNLLFNRTISRT